jgi:hypothetical protein
LTNITLSSITTRNVHFSLFLPADRIVYPPLPKWTGGRKCRTQAKKQDSLSADKLPGQIKPGSFLYLIVKKDT